MSACYFNHASYTPLLPAVKDQLMFYINEWEDADYKYYDKLTDFSKKLKKLVATILDVSVQSVTIQPNTASFLSAIAQGIQWEPGDKIIMFDNEGKIVYF